MRRIHYANDVLVTADRVAEAVMSYAKDLAIQRLSDTVSIPVLASDGHIGHTQLLLGPASQISSTELQADEGSIAELDDRFPEPPYFSRNPARDPVYVHGFEDADADGDEIAAAMRYLEEG